MHCDLTTGDTYVDKGTLTVKMFANASGIEGYRLDCKWKLTDEKVLNIGLNMVQMLK